MTQTPECSAGFPRRKSIRRSVVRRKFSRGNRLDACLKSFSQSVSMATDIHHMSVVQQPVQKGGGQDSKAIISHTIGGLCAGISAHWIYMLLNL